MASERAGDGAVRAPVAAAEAWLELSRPWLPAPNDPTGAVAGCRVTVRQPGLEAYARVSLAPEEREAERLAAFFADLAREWRGWDGERRGAFGDGRLVLSAAHDRRRSVVLRVDLADEVAGWRVSGAVALEPGGLAALAAAMRAFLRLPGGGPPGRDD